MKKVQIQNSYSDWSYSDSVKMHELQLKWTSWFAWSNLFWATGAIYFFSQSWLLTLGSFPFLFILVMKLTDDHEFISPLQDKEKSTPTK